MIYEVRNPPEKSWTWNCAGHRYSHCCKGPRVQHDGDHLPSGWAVYSYAAYCSLACALETQQFLVEASKMPASDAPGAAS